MAADLAALSTGATDQGLLNQGLVVQRIVGSLRVNSEAAMLSVEWAAGITPIEFDAASASVFPDPNVGNDFHPWMWWMGRVSPPPGAGGTSIQIELDIKAKRKLIGRGPLMFIINNHDAVEGLEFALSVRVLFRLP